MDDRALACWRIHSLGLSTRRFVSPAGAVEGLLAVQAENHAQACWAVATRCDGALTDADMARVFDDGELLRTHVLRPTWHYVRPDDIRWLVEVTAPRVRRIVTQHQQELGIADHELDAAAELIERSLSGGVHLTREELGERLADAGLPGEGRPLATLVFNAEMTGLVCSGRMNGRSHTYALLEERAPSARRLDRDEALAELVLRYFTGHGPATERDLAYWATLTLADVRAGLAAVADQLESVEVGDRTYWYRQPPPDDGTFSPRAHLLQVLDEYHHGYQDSRDVLDADGLVAQGRPAAMGMVVLDGQMVGDMKRTVRDADVTFDVHLLRDLAADELHALDEAGDRYGTYLGRDAVVTTRR